MTMRKWIFNSWSLNIFALISFISFFVYINPFIQTIVASGSGVGGFMGFVFAPISLFFSTIVLITYAIEIIVFFIFKKFSLSFPYTKIQCKILYYPIFFIGMIWGNLFIIYAFLILLLSPVFSILNINIG